MSLAVAILPLIPSVKNTFEFYFFEVCLQTIINPVIDFVTGVSLSCFYLNMGVHLEK